MKKSKPRGGTRPDVGQSRINQRGRKPHRGWTTMGRSAVTDSNPHSGRRHLLRRVLIAAAILALGWLTFLDSHSLVKRLRWHAERDALQAENSALTLEIERLEREVEKGLSDEVVESVAREQYGMRRPGEIVYRVETVE